MQQASSSARVIPGKVRVAVRRARGGIPARQLDPSAATQEDLEQDMLTRLWEVQQRRPDVGEGYLWMVVWNEARMSRRDNARARSAEGAVRSHGVSWQRPGDTRDTLAYLEARDVLRRLPEDVLARLLEAEDGRTARVVRREHPEAMALCAEAVRG
jgi:hypothetical protein